MVVNLTPQEGSPVTASRLLELLCDFSDKSSSVGSLTTPDCTTATNSNKIVSQNIFFCNLTASVCLLSPLRIFL